MNDFELPTKILILTDPEEILDALKASMYKYVLWQYDNWLRSEVKYKGNEDAQVYRDKLREFMEDNKVDID